MALEDIKEQDHIVKYLKSILRKDRIPPMLLLSGRKGTGRFLAATMFAKALNCVNSTDDCCDKCKSCVAIEHRAHPNMIVIGRDADVVKIEYIRDMINASFVPLNNGYRVNIIDNSDKSTPEAFSCMLKYLEEPPERTVNILIAEMVELLPETIKSRAVELKFRSLSAAFIKETAKKKGLSDEDAEIVSKMANGSMEKIKLFSSKDFLKKRKIFIEYLLNFLLDEVIVSKLLEEWKNFSGSNDSISNAKEFFDIFATLLQDILFVSVLHDTEHITNVDALGFIADKFAFVDRSKLHKMYGVVLEKNQALLTNAIQQYILLDGLFKIKEVIK
jgi:DNA polymerase III gamma/tau subunit